MWQVKHLNPINIALYENILILVNKVQINPHIQGEHYFYHVFGGTTTENQKKKKFTQLFERLQVNT